MRLSDNGLKPTLLIKMRKKCKTSVFSENLIIAWILGFSKNRVNGV
jgi:hypothetical protein